MWSMFELPLSVVSAAPGGTGGVWSTVTVCPLSTPDVVPVMANPALASLALSVLAVLTVLLPTFGVMAESVRTGGCRGAGASRMIAGVTTAGSVVPRGADRIESKKLIG